MGKMLMKSRYIRIALAVLIVLMVGLSVLGGIYLKDNAAVGTIPDDLNLEGVEVVIPFGEYKECGILNADKGYVWGRKGENRIDLLDIKTDRKTILDRVYSIEDLGNDKVDLLRRGKRVVAKIEELFEYDSLSDYLKNHENEPVAETVETVESGKYTIHYRELDDDNLGQVNSWVTDETGKTLCNGHYIDFIGIDGIVDVTETGADEHSLFNLETGEKLQFEWGNYYLGTLGENILIFSSENPEVTINTDMYYFLNKDFEVNEEFGKVVNIRFDKKNRFLYFERMNDKLGEQNIPYIINDKLEVIYEGSTDTDFIGFAGDYAAFGTENNKVDYMALDSNKEDILGRSEYSFMDFDDGIAVAAIGEREEAEELSNIFRIGVQGNERYKFGFIDENMNHVTEFTFDNVWETQDGYAVAMIGRKCGLLKFKEAS